MRAIIRALTFVIAITVAAAGCSHDPTGPWKDVGPRLDVAPATVSAGDSIRLELTLSNTGRFGTSLECPSWRWEVRHFDGRLLYSLLALPSLDACAGTIVLEPGESRTLTAWWRVTDQGGTPAPPDTYSIRAQVRAGGRQVATVVTTATSFRVTTPP